VNTNIVIDPPAGNIWNHYELSSLKYMVSSVQHRTLN